MTDTDRAKYALPLYILARFAMPSGEWMYVPSPKHENRYYQDTNTDINETHAPTLTKNDLRYGKTFVTLQTFRHLLFSLS
jgi:hypothetical protein